MSAPVADDFSRREFPMTDGDFRKIQDTAYRLTGILLSNNKKTLVYGRLVRRLRHLKLAKFSDYCQLLEQDDGLERTEFINAITTNLTAFFREGYHFTHLRQNVIPGLIEKNRDRRTLRLWSAGCSTGEEAYSIAMVLKAVRSLADWDIRIAATDLDSKVINAAREGVYPAEKAHGIPAEYHRFLKFNRRQGTVDIAADVRDLISFRALNLLDGWPIGGPFDIIFCRNVIIYFDEATQQKLLVRFANVLSPAGYLYLGHSENLLGISEHFRSLGRTTYQKNLPEKK